MGKRRSDMPHKDRYAGGDSDDDDDVVEEVQQEEPLTEEVKTNIQSRKKLVAKRRVAETTSNPPATPFSLFSGSLGSKPIETSSEDKPSVFSGFKGFSAFNTSSNAPSSTTTTSLNSTAPAPSLLTSQTPASSILLDSSNKTNTSNSTFSFLNSNKPASQPASQPAQSQSSFFTQIAKQTSSISSTNNTNNITTMSSTISASDAKEDDSSQQKNNNSSKNIKDVELKFINGLNELYESCYGSSSSKRSYKLPEDVILNSDQSENFASQDSESKYAYMLAELNKHCSKWISKHIEESPLVILTPVFVDYFNYLILLEKQFFPNSFAEKSAFTQQTKQSESSMNGVQQSSSLMMNGHKEDKETDQQPKFPALFKASSTTSGPALAPISLSNEGPKASTNTTPSFSSTAPSTFSFPKSTATTAITPVVENKSATTSSAEVPSVTNITNPLSGSSGIGSFKFGSDLLSKPKTTNETETSKSSGGLFSNFASNTTTTTPSAASTTTPAVSTTTPASSTSLTGSAPLFRFGSGSANSANTTTSSSTFSSFSTADTTAPATTPAMSLFANLNKKTEEENKTDTTDIKSVSPAMSFFSNLNKASTTTTTTTATPVASTAPTTATNAQPFFSFGQANSGAPKAGGIFSSLGSGGDTKSIFGSSTTPFGSTLGGSGSSMFGGGAFNAQPAGGEGGEGEGGEEDEKYEPPKPETSDVKEEGAVLTKRIKLFYYNEKEKKFSDRGIGNLFIKPINDGESTQLIVRADTKLASILLNVKLSKSLPVSKAGPKDVSYLCLPNPPIPNVESNVPCKFLFKVKTEEDAAELLEKMNEYKR